MKPILITGASSGIGHATALHLQNLGYEVFATIRKQADAAKLANPILLDLQDPAAIEAIPQQIPSHLYAVINNAGHNYISPFENATEQGSRALMETNFFGLVHLTRVLIPSLRRYTQTNPKQFARILNISSIGGLIGLPWESFYHASKFAVVGVTESLRHELWQENIRATVVCPGGIRTPFLDKTKREIMEALANTNNPRYQASLKLYSKLADQATTMGSPAEKVAKGIANLLRQSNPPFRKLIGADAHVLSALSTLLPIRLFHYFIRKSFLGANIE